jgi:BASS family bile acid:Na+ symporter
MNTLDDVRVHFNPNQLLFLNLALGFLMFSVSFDINLRDFKSVIANPRAPIIGLICQYFLFPVLTMAMVYAVRPEPTVALGLVLVSACPSGNMANFMTNYAKGNLPLSVSLNSVITLGAAFSTPLVFHFWSQFLPDKSNLVSEIQIPFVDMVTIIAQVIVLPLIIGLSLRHYFPDMMLRIKKVVSILALLLFFGIIAGAIAGNWQNIKDHLSKVFLWVAIHNGIALAMGYATARAAKLSITDCRTIALESGIHNTLLGLILIFNFFGGIGGMAMIAAWWGIWDLIMAFSLASYWRSTVHVMNEQ